VNNLKGTIYKRGKKYSIIVDIGKDANGKRIQKWFSGYTSKKEAEKALVKIINDLEENTFITPDKITLGEFLTNWLDTYVKTNLEKTTSYGYENNIINHIIPYIGNIKLQKLQPMNIDNLYYQLLKDGRVDGKGGLSPKSIRYVHRNLREALHYAYKLQIISKNPADLVDPPKVKEFEASFLEEHEVINMLDKLKTEQDLFLIVLLAVGLGLRRGEVLALKWKNIYFDEEILEVKETLNRVKGKLYFGEPKTKNSKRAISIPKSILKVLKSHKKSQDILKLKIGNNYNRLDLVNCKTDGNPITPDSINSKFKRRLIKFGLPKIRFHDLRHTNASLMLKYGVPAKVASGRLGHANIQITMDLYSHIVRDIDFEAAAKINKGLFENF
jgi:integrase